MARNLQNQSEEQDNVRSLLPYLGGAALLGMYQPANQKIMQKQLERWKAKGYDAKLQTHDPMKGWVSDFIKEIKSNYIWQEYADLSTLRSQSDRTISVGGDDPLSKFEDVLHTASMAKDVPVRYTDTTIGGTKAYGQLVSTGANFAGLTVYDTSTGEPLKSQPFRKWIEIDPQRSKGIHQLKTFAHELGHLYLDHHELDLPSFVEEMQAETAAYGVMRKTGLTSNRKLSGLTKSSAAYVAMQGFDEIDAYALLRAATPQLERTVNEIFPGTTESQKLVLGDRKPVDEPNPSKFQASYGEGFEYGQKFVSPKTGKIASLEAIDSEQALLRNFQGKEIKLTSDQLGRLQVKAPADLNAPKLGDGLIAQSGNRYTVTGLDDAKPVGTVRLRSSETGQVRTAKISDISQKFTANPLGFTRTPALTSILGVGVGATAGNVAFRSLAKAVGLNEEQQQTAGNIGSVVGGFTGGTLGYGRNPDLKAPTLQDFAKAIASKNTDAGAVYLFGGSRTAAKIPHEVEKTLDTLVQGDRKPFLVLGDASGVDAIALDYAKRKNIPYEVMTADWSQGTMGGTKRDYEAVMAAKQISDTGYFGDKGDVKAHYFSVDKSLGTQHMANAALTYDIPTKMTYVESNLDRIVSVQEDLPDNIRSKVEKLLAKGVEPRESLVYASDKPIKKGEARPIAVTERALQYKVLEPQAAVYQKGTADYDLALRKYAEGYKLSDDAIANLKRYAPVQRFMPAEEHARLSLFKGLRGTGLDLTQMARLSVPGIIPNPKDDLTGFIRGIEERDRTAKRAIEFTQKTGQQGHYISADIANLGGLNSTLGETGANKVYRKFTDIYSEELKAVGDRYALKDFSLSNFRQGGDEFSSIVYGLKGEQIEEAVGNARLRIADYVREQGLEGIEHPKYKGDITRQGTGVTTAFAPLDPNRPLEETYGLVDKQLEANKKQVRQSLDRRFEERSLSAQALDFPYDLQKGDILDPDKFTAHLEALPAHEQTMLLDRLARSSSAEANSWKEGLPKDQVDSIQKQSRLEAKTEARPDWSKLKLEEAPLQPGILSGARQNAWKSAKQRGEKPPNLAYFLGGEPGVAIAEKVDKFVKSSQQSLKSGYIAQPEFDASVSAIAQKIGVSEQVARSAVAQGRDIEGATQILSERLPPKPVLSMQQAKQTITEMQQKYSGGTVGTPDVAIAPEMMRDRTVRNLKGKAGHINQIGGEIGLEVLQGADYAAKSLRRGENIETAIARAGTASATSLGASRIIGASLAKAPLPGIVKVGAQFVGAGLAAFGADEVISKAIGFDAEKAQRYQEREMRALGETESDRNKYSFQYVYNQATEGNQIANTIRPVTDIAGSIIDSFNPVHIAKNLGESLANYANRDSIAQSMYLNQRSDSMDAARVLKAEKGADNFSRSRSLALQNLVNESGESVQRSGRFDGDTYDALRKKGYSQQQIQDYLRGKSKVLGRPVDRDRNLVAVKNALLRSQGREVYTPSVTGQTLSAALSEVRKSANLKPGQRLSEQQVQGVFAGLAGKPGGLNSMSSLAGGFR